jgi:hypothetical protein
MATNNSVFYNKRSINEVKAANPGCPFEWGEGNKAGIFAFTCGNTEGLVSEKARLHLEAKGAPERLMVADVDYTDNEGNPKTCTMLMMAATGIKKVLGTL